MGGGVSPAQDQWPQSCMRVDFERCTCKQKTRGVKVPVYTLIDMQSEIHGRNLNHSVYVHVIYRKVQ